MKIISIFAIFLGMISSVLSMESPREPIENPNSRTTFYTVPEVTLQEKELEKKVRSTILRESRKFSIEQRLAILRFINLLDGYQASVESLCRFEKYKRTDQSEADKLYENIIKAEKEIKKYLRSPRFRSDRSSDDPNKVYPYPPFSLASQRQIVEALSKLYYLEPSYVAFQVNCDNLPPDFFPIKIMFLQPKDSRDLLFHETTFVKKLPENIRASTSKIRSLRTSVPKPCTWTYPKDTYLRRVYRSEHEESIQEVEWRNLFQENILIDEDYNEKNWNLILQNTSQFLQMKNEDSGFEEANDLGYYDSNYFELVIYYGADKKLTSLDGTDVIFINNHGNISCYNKYFTNVHLTRSSVSIGSFKSCLNFTLDPTGFYTPKDFHRIWVEEIKRETKN